MSSTRGHTFHPDSEIGQSTFLQTRRIVGGLGLVRYVGTKNFANAWRTLQPYVETHFLESFQKILNLKRFTVKSEDLKDVDVV